MGRGLLLLVSGFIIIFGIIQQSTHNKQQVLAARAPEYYYQEQSRNIAGAMLEIALGNVNDGTNYYPTNVSSSIDNRTVEMMGGTGKISVQNMTNFNTRLFVKITGEIQKPDGTTAITIINAVFNRKAFSIYAYFTDKEKTASGSTIYFTTGDVLNGPVHTNGTFHIQGDPVFNGPTTSQNGIQQSWGSDPTFNDSKDFSVNEVTLPTDAPEVIKLAQKKNGGIGQFTDKIYVEFKGGDNSKNNDGIVEISKAIYGCSSYDYNGNCTVQNYIPDLTTTLTYNLSDFNDVISSTKNVYVKGQIDGQATVHSIENVKIMGDLEYENRNYNDKSSPISDDRLGIVSKKNTIVDKYAQYDHGYSNITIDASILTLGKSFEVEDHSARGNRGTIHLLGGLIQKTRGPVGMVDGRGFSKDYTYDTRFAENSTPGFPRKQRFEIEKWRESTTTEKGSN